MKRSILLLLVLAACSKDPVTRPPAHELVWTPAPPPDPTAPIIDEIRVEKDNVCQGEEDLVSIRAHTPDGTDRCLHYAVSYLQGRQVPLRFYQDRYPPHAAAFGCQNQMTWVELPAVKVWDCHAPGLQVTAAGQVNTEVAFRFDAELQWADGFSPVRWRWDFGDGATAETAEPTATHDYWQVVQGDYLQLLVTATAVDAAGGEVTGRVALQLLDRAADWRSHGLALVHAQPVGTSSVDGTVVAEDWWLWHHEPGPVTLTQATGVRLHEDGTDDVVAVDLASLATIPALAPDERTLVTFRHDFSLDPLDVIGINFTITGQAPALPAEADVSMGRRYPVTR